MFWFSTFDVGHERRLLGPKDSFEDARSAMHQEKGRKAYFYRLPTEDKLEANSMIPV